MYYRSFLTMTTKYEIKGSLFIIIHAKIGLIVQIMTQQKKNLADLYIRNRWNVRSSIKYPMNRKKQQNVGFGYNNSYCFFSYAWIISKTLLITVPNKTNKKHYLTFLQKKLQYF